MANNTNTETTTLAKVTIGSYDVEPGNSGRPFIEVAFAGEDPIIVTEEDPSAELETANDTLIDPYLDESVYAVLLKSGLATEVEPAHCDPNDNGGFVARVFRVKAEGEFIVHTDYTVTEA